MKAALLRIDGLQIALPKGADRPFALAGLDLDVEENEIVCLVGESGSGKSLTAGAIMRLLPEPHVRVAGGRVLFEGRDLASLGTRQMRALRGSQIAMIFQEPMTALNPQKTVGWQIDEVLREHTDLSRAQRHRRILEILDEVRIPDSASAIAAYPHQISGGQRQRVMIAWRSCSSPS